MIERYTRAPMGKLWSTEFKFDCLLKIEKAVAEAQGALKIIPLAASRAISKKGKFQIAKILELEKETKHDVIAFVSNVAVNVGEYGKYVHFGLTSSDVLDSALSLQIRDAAIEFNKTLAGLEKALKSLAKKYQSTPCVGRTHGIHAEPTTFGLKISGFLAEHQRNQERFNHAVKQAVRIKLSGAVGTYSAMGMEVEKRVSDKLKIPVETVATQVIPRDRHGELMWSLAMIGAQLERLATEIRHLQRTEVGEVEEGFSKGQKGSSAMPHKKNPIGSENITGLSRLLRSNLMAALENIALWHERDISHSSVERIIFPDSFILADYAASRMTEILNTLVIKEKKMQENLNFTSGQVYSSHLLLALVQKGLSREEAYKIVQSASFEVKNGKNLKTEILKNPEAKKLLSKKDVADIFSGKKHQAQIKKVIERVL